jgi:hypothetical protein
MRSAADDLRECAPFFLLPQTESTGLLGMQKKVEMRIQMYEETSPCLLMRHMYAVTKSGVDCSVW